MASWADVRRVALALPEVTEERDRQWKVRGKALAWERPLRRKDLDELGGPQGEVLGVSVPDEGAKHALIADEPDVYFTTSHFDGYAAVLVRLDRIAPSDLVELLDEAWTCRAPKRLVKERLA